MEFASVVSNQEVYWFCYAKLCYLDFMTEGGKTFVRLRKFFDRVTETKFT